jgi:PAS domain S-box-containing protein
VGRKRAPGCVEHVSRSDSSGGSQSATASGGSSEEERRGGDRASSELRRFGSAGMPGLDVTYRHRGKRQHSVAHPSSLEEAGEERGGGEGDDGGADDVEGVVGRQRGAGEGYGADGSRTGRGSFEESLAASPHHPPQGAGASPGSRSDAVRGGRGQADGHGVWRATGGPGSGPHGAFARVGTGARSAVGALRSTDAGSGAGRLSAPHQGDGAPHAAPGAAKHPSAAPYGRGQRSGGRGTSRPLAIDLQSDPGRAGSAGGSERLSAAVPCAASPSCGSARGRGSRAPSAASEAAAAGSAGWGIGSLDAASGAQLPTAAGGQRGGGSRGRGTAVSGRSNRLTPHGVSCASTAALPLADVAATVEAVVDAASAAGDGRASSRLPRAASRGAAAAAAAARALEEDGDLMLSGGRRGLGIGSRASTSARGAATPAVTADPAALPGSGARSSGVEHESGAGRGGRRSRASSARVSRADASASASLSLLASRAGSKTPHATDEGAAIVCTDAGVDGLDGAPFDADADAVRARCVSFYPVPVAGDDAAASQRHGNAGAGRMGVGRSRVAGVGDGRDGDEAFDGASGSAAPAAVAGGGAGDGSDDGVSSGEGEDSQTGGSVGGEGGQASATGPRPPWDLQRRREANRLNARKSRMRKKRLLESSMSRLGRLEAEVAALRRYLAEACGVTPQAVLAAARTARPWPLPRLQGAGGLIVGFETAPARGHGGAAAAANAAASAPAAVPHRAPHSCNELPEGGLLNASPRATPGSLYDGAPAPRRPSALLPSLPDADTVSHGRATSAFGGSLSEQLSYACAPACASVDSSAGAYACAPACASVGDSSATGSACPPDLEVPVSPSVAGLVAPSLPEIMGASAGVGRCGRSGAGGSAGKAAMDVGDASAGGTGSAAQELLSFQNTCGHATGGCADSPAFPPIHEAGLSFLCEGLPRALQLGAETPLHALPSAAPGLSVTSGPNQRKSDFLAAAASASACSGRSPGSGRASAGSGRSSRLTSASAAAAAALAASERAAHYARLRSDATSSAGTVPPAAEETDDGAAARGNRSGSTAEAASTHALVGSGYRNIVMGAGAGAMPPPAAGRAGYAPEHVIAGALATTSRHLSSLSPGAAAAGAMGAAGVGLGAARELSARTVSEVDSDSTRASRSAAEGGKSAAGSSSDDPAAATASVTASVSALPAVDLALVSALDRCHTSFTISDPSLPDNPLVFASDGFLALSGYSHAEVLGRNCRLLQGSGTDRATVARISAALQAGRAVTAYLLNYRKDGRPFWCYLSISPLRDTEGRIRSFVGVQARADAVPERPLPRRPALREASANEGRASLGAQMLALSAGSSAAPPLAPPTADAVAVATPVGAQHSTHG